VVWHIQVKKGGIAGFIKKGGMIRALYKEKGPYIYKEKGPVILRRGPTLRIAHTRNILLQA